MLKIAARERRRISKGVRGQRRPQKYRVVERVEGERDDDGDEVLKIWR